MLYTNLVYHNNGKRQPISIVSTIAGYGKSRSGQVSDPVSFMTNLISSLSLANLIIVSPSMSGFISLPFLTAHPEKIKGYIPVAPVETGKYKTLYASIKVNYRCVSFFFLEFLLGGGEW